MTKTLDFIFDFASPNAYLSYHALSPILERTGAQVNLIPCLLGGIFKLTDNQAPMMAFANIKGKLEYDRIEMNRFIERHSLSAFKPNPHFPVNTLLMMRAATAAEMEGCLDQDVEAGLKHMWEDGLKMDDPEVFAGAMDSAGLDGKHLIERAQADEVKAKLLERTSAAAERGVFGIPTFFIGDEIFFGKERLGQVEEELLK